MTPFLPRTDSSITAASIASLVSSCRLQGSTLVPFLFPPSVAGFRWEFMSLGSFFMASSLPERWELPWRHRWAPESWGGWDWRCFVLAWNSEVIYQSVSNTTVFVFLIGTETVISLATLCSTKSVHHEWCSLLEPNSFLLITGTQRMDSQLSVPGQNSKCEVKKNSEDFISRTILAKYFHK